MKNKKFRMPVVSKSKAEITLTQLVVSACLVALAYLIYLTLITPAGRTFGQKVATCLTSGTCNF